MIEQNLNKLILTFPTPDSATTFAAFLQSLLQTSQVVLVPSSPPSGQLPVLAVDSLSPSPMETEDFLEAVDRVSALEHQADDAERALAASAIQHAKDFRQLHLFTAIGGKFEAAADALKHVSLLLRDHVLEDVIDG